MSIIKPLLVSDLGALYDDWRAAPAGTMLAFGAPLATGRANSWTASHGQRIAVRADNGKGEKFLVAIKPDILLIEPPGAGFTPSIVTIAEGPAIDISKHYGLGIINLTPHLPTEELENGDVVAEIGTGSLLAYAGNEGHDQRYLVLRGDRRGELVGRPDKVYVVGKLAAVELP